MQLVRERSLTLPIRLNRVSIWSDRPGNRRFSSALWSTISLFLSKHVWQLFFLTAYSAWKVGKFPFNIEIPQFLKGHVLDCCDTNIAVDSPLRSSYITTQPGMSTSTLIQLFTHRSKLTIDSRFFLTIGNRKHVGKSCDSRTQKVKFYPHCFSITKNLLSSLVLIHRRLFADIWTNVFPCNSMDPEELLESCEATILSWTLCWTIPSKKSAPLKNITSAWW